MKVKISQLVQSAKSFRELKLPVLLAFEYAEAIKQVDEQLKNYEMVRNEKIKEYGEKNEKGEDEIKTGSPKIVEFMNDMKELLEKEVDINFPIIKKEDIRNVDIDMNTLMNLEFLITK